MKDSLLCLLSLIIHFFKKKNGICCTLYVSVRSGQNTFPTTMQSLSLQSRTIISGKEKKTKVKHRDGHQEGAACFRSPRTGTRRGLHIKVFGLWND